MTRALRAFLRGTRPNPARVWRLERRHLEGGDWLPVTETASWEGARDEVDALRLPPGDLARVLRPDGGLWGLWVALRDMMLEAPPLPTLYDPRTPTDWLDLWEGRSFDGKVLLRLAETYGVDARRLVLAACDVAAWGAPLPAPYEALRQEALAAARDWARLPLGPAEAALRATAAARALTAATAARGAAEYAPRNHNYALRAAAQAAEGIALRSSVLDVPLSQLWSMGAPSRPASAEVVESTRRALRARIVARIPLSILFASLHDLPTPEPERRIPSPS